MKLILLHGAPGVGKLTVGKEVAKLTGFALFHNHLVIDLLAQVFPSNSPSYLKLREEMWLSVVRYASADRLAGLVFTFVYESSTLPGFFDRLRQSLAPLDRLYPVELRCDLQENERRLMQPDRLAYLKLSSGDYLREWVQGARFSAPAGLPDNFVIDNTALSAANAAKAIISHIQDDEAER